MRSGDSLKHSCETCAWYRGPVSETESFCQTVESYNGLPVERQYIRPVSKDSKQCPEWKALPSTSHIGPYVRQRCNNDIYFQKEVY